MSLRLPSLDELSSESSQSSAEGGGGGGHGTQTAAMYVRGVLAAQAEEKRGSSKETRTLNQSKHNIKNKQDTTLASNVTFSSF